MLSTSDVTELLDLLLFITYPTLCTEQRVRNYHMHVCSVRQSNHNYAVLFQWHSFATRPIRNAIWMAIKVGHVAETTEAVPTATTTAATTTATATHTHAHMYTRTHTHTTCISANNNIITINSGNNKNDNNCSSR